MNGVCKVADFGWATWLKEGEYKDEVCGTPGYSSPQIMNMQRYGQKTDCWSLGVLAYELISGPLPEAFFKDGFAGVNVSELGAS